LIDIADPLTESAWNQATRLAMAGAGLVGPDVLARLDQITSSELAALDLSAVRVDDEGVVQSINPAALDLAGVSSADAVGHNFFTDLAPCTNNRIFRGVFARGVNTGAMNLVFFYAFTYRLSPTEVKVHMHRTPAGNNWILVRRR
jgi:photoactive yellow protein